MSKKIIEYSVFMYLKTKPLVCLTFDEPNGEDYSEEVLGKWFDEQAYVEHYSKPFVEKEYEKVNIYLGAYSKPEGSL